MCRILLNSTEKKFITLIQNTRKKERSQNQQYLIATFENSMESKTNTVVEERVTNIEVEISGIEKIQAIEKNQWNESWFLAKINEIDISQDRVLRKNERDVNYHQE